MFYNFCFPLKHFNISASEDHEVYLEFKKKQKEVSITKLEDEPEKKKKKKSILNRLRFKAKSIGNVK